MAEHNLSARLMKQLKLVGHAQRLENLTGAGVPDVNYCIAGVEGHIENKWRLAWPKINADHAIVTMAHYTQAQRQWAMARARAGGLVFVLLQVQTPHNDYLLFDGAWAARHLGHLTRDQLIGAALAHGRGAFPWPAIYRHLTRDTSS